MAAAHDALPAGEAEMLRDQVAALVAQWAEPAPEGIVLRARYIVALAGRRRKSTSPTPTPTPTPTPSSVSRVSDARAWVAGHDEAETVAALLVAFREHLGREGPSDNAFLAGVERLVEDPATEFLLAAPHDDAPPAGVAQLRFRHSLWTAAPDCWLEDVFVAEPARRAGLARALAQLACDRARERGCRRIELDASEGNAAALALYEALGFTARSKGSGARDLLLGRAL